MAISIDGTTGISASGNITGNNVITTSTFAPASVSTAGNVTGSYILGDGSLLTGLSGSSISSGTSNVTVVSSGGNVTTSVGGTSNVAVFATTGAFITGVLSATGNITGGNISATNHTGTTVSVSGTVTAASVVGGVITGTSTSVSGTTTAASVVGGVITGTSVSASGAVTGAALTGTSLTVSTGNVSCGNIVNANGNAVGNIGSSSLYFNTVFAKATSAQYADLAEMYVADQKYPPGTILEFGGANEVTQTTRGHSTAVAGIVSTNPSYLMNATQTGNNVVAVALVGRVPCRVVGTIQKGDRLVSSAIAGTATAYNPSEYQPGCIIGKALEDYNSINDGVIEVAVGRN